MIDISTPESVLELFSTIAVILVIGVLVILYIAYYWQTNHAKRRRAEAMKNQIGSMRNQQTDVPYAYTTHSSREST